MLPSLIKKTFINCYIRTNDSVICYPLGEVNPDTFDASKIPAITTALGDCLDSAEIIAVKKVEGYVLGYGHEKTPEETPTPITPYIFDLNDGWIGTGNGVWTPESPTKCYLDVYEVEGGTRYYLTLGESVGTRFRVIFTTVDVSQATKSVTGVAVNNSNFSDPAPYSNCYYTPETDGYIVVQKDNAGTSGIKTYLYDASEGTTVVTEFDVVSIVSLQVFPPIKTSYRVGEQFDWTGATIYALYDGGHNADVTSEATFSPASGTTVTSSDPATSITLPVTVSYKGVSASFDVTVQGVALVSLEITQPTKRIYSKSEALDYTGFTATAVYGDGATKDVTEAVTFSTEAGSTISADTTITASYTEGTDTVTNNFSVIVPNLQSLQITPPTKTEYYEFGETLDYTGLKVVAKYSNMPSVDVTSDVVINYPDGSVITQDMTYFYNDSVYFLNISISYTDSWGNKKTSAMDHTLTVPKSYITITKPTKTSYYEGEILDYTGLKVEFLAKNGDKIDVTSEVEMSIAEGTVARAPNSWVAYYKEHGQHQKITVTYTTPSGDTETNQFSIRILYSGDA